MVPPVRVELVGRGAPELGEPVDRVGEDVDGRARGDEVVAQLVVREGLAHRHGDWGDVAQGFAADVVQVGQLVWVDLGDRVGVLPRGGVEEERVVGADLLAELVLDVMVLAEEVQCP